MDHDLLLGVEEEYLVIDPATRHVVPGSAAVVHAAQPGLGAHVGTEITQFQVEARTEPCATIAELSRQLHQMRAVIARAAADRGYGVVASGTPVLGDVVPPPITEHPRYEVGTGAYRALHDEQSICALHVHVHLPDHEQAVLVGNHLRPWLPVLIAMMANSPFWAGRDTGYASWRTLSWGKWPVAGPPPYFSSAADYDQTVSVLTDAGVLVDPGTIFWDVRPSARLPTLEVRVADVPVTASESALFATLVRALVSAALEKISSGDHGPRLRDAWLRAACWRAARDGLAGHGIEVVSGKLTPADTLIDKMLGHTRPALEAFGDLEGVEAGLRRLRLEGTGAARQRSAYARRGSLTDVVDFLADELTDVSRM